MCNHVTWKKTEDDNWADFSEEGLRQFEGDKDRPYCVYLIWSETESRMVYVGSGEVERLWDHLRPNGPSYRAIHSHKNLKATYALINDNDILGAEGFLALGYEPLEGNRHPREMVKVGNPDNGIPFRTELYNTSTEGLEMRHDMNNARGR